MDVTTFDHRVVIPTADFLGMLSDVLPFAADPRVDDALAIVRVHWDGEGLLDVQATNGTASGMCAWSPDDEPAADVQTDMFSEPGGGSEPWTVFIDSVSAKMLVTDFKIGDREPTVMMTLEHDDRTNVLRASRIRESRRPGKIVEIGGYGDMPHFIDVRVRITAPDNAEPLRLSEVALPVWALALFGKVRDRGGHSTFTFITDRIAAVTIGPRFVGAVSLVRERDPRDDLVAQTSDDSGLPPQDHWLRGYPR